MAVTGQDGTESISVLTWLGDAIRTHARALLPHSSLFRYPTTTDDDDDATQQVRVVRIMNYGQPLAIDLSFSITAMTSANDNLLIRLFYHESIQ